ncbi:MAG: methyltransferase domain-containing protein [Deltaproteobacteria bacterium]|nr:methyltransferase domain-containing protein [Deltaproteobacteria bacterium]
MTPRLKRGAVVLLGATHEPACGATLFEARDSLTPPQAWDVDAADIPALCSLCLAPQGGAKDGRGGGAHDEATRRDLIARLRAVVPDVVRDDAVDDELAALHAFAADRRFTLEFLSATEAMAAPQDTEAFHQDVIADADVNFDDVETTLAHLFARPTAALAGRHYGAAFCDHVLDELRPDLLVPGRPGAAVQFAELGCGTGRFAHDFLARLQERTPALYASSTYTLVDLSPALQQSQRRRCAPHGDRCRFVLGDLLAWQPDRAVDVVISNEVIADLPVRPLYRDDVSTDHGEAAACVRRHGLSLAGLPHATLINTGAIALVERLPQLLAKDGVAVVTEYGSRTRGPVRVALGGHVEHSIHYGHLEDVAARVGLQPTIARVVDLLGFDESTRVVDLEHLDVLRRAVGPSLGLPPLPRMAFSVDDVRAWLGPHAPRVRHVVDAPLSIHAMRADLFLALVVRRLVAG